MSAEKTNRSEGGDNLGTGTDEYASNSLQLSDASSDDGILEQEDGTDRRTDNYALSKYDASLFEEAIRQYSERCVAKESECKSAIGVVKDVAACTKIKEAIEGIRERFRTEIEAKKELKDALSTCKVHAESERRSLSQVDSMGQSVDQVDDRYSKMQTPNISEMH